MRTFVPMIASAAMVQIAPVAFSQTPAASGTVATGKEWKQGQRERLGNLSPEERQKFINARRQAMQDPTVKAAREKMRQAGKEFHDALEAAMLKADPTIKPLLDKLPKGPAPAEHED